MEGKKVVQIVASNSKSYALTSDGKLFGWGSNAKLGTGASSGNQLLPALINLSNVPAGKYVTFISSPDSSALVVQSQPPGHLVCEFVDCPEVLLATCYGTSSLFSSVCSSRGTCIADDNCKCNQGWGGYTCQRKCADCYLNY